MNRGLYAFAGDSATASDAAWANRLLAPTTNRSNVNLRLPPFGEGVARLNVVVAAGESVSLEEAGLSLSCRDAVTCGSTLAPTTADDVII